MMTAKPEGVSHEDYKLIDELLLDLMRERGLQPIDLWATNDSLMFDAIRRVHKAYTEGKTVTMTWATFFQSLPPEKP